MPNLSGFNDLRYNQLTEDIIPYSSFYTLRKEEILALGKGNPLSPSLHSNIKKYMIK